jgi:hypothetical protein
VGPARVVDGFFDSPERRALQEQGRAPAVTPAEALKEALAAEWEVIRINANHPPASVLFVTALYNQVLGQSPTPTGLRSWVGRLNRGVRPARVVAGFFRSSERRKLEQSGTAPAITRRTALVNAIHSLQNLRLINGKHP